MQISRHELPGTVLAAALNVSDIEVFQEGARQFVYLTSAYTGTISIMEIFADQAPILIETLESAIPSTSLSIPDVTLSLWGDGPSLLHGLGTGTEVGMRMAQSDGTLSDVVTFSTGDSNSDGQVMPPIEYMLSVTIGQISYVVASHDGVAGLNVFSMDENQQLVSQDSVVDTDTAFVADIVALAETSVAGQRVVLATSSEDAGITSYFIGEDGSMRERDTIGAGSDLWVSTPTELETIKVGSSVFALLGAAGSSSITVVELTQGGYMSVVDHVIDEGGTFFQNLSALETVQVDGRSFVFAGGADNGISMMELDPSGQLHHVTDITDPGGATITDVQSIQATQVGTEVQVLVASGAGGSVASFSIDVSDLGQVFDVGTSQDALHGTMMDDLILGGAGADDLYGGGGDDRVVDGGGQDFMEGGAGADVFVMVADGQSDTIFDFELGVDRIDVSDWSLIYDMSRMEVSQFGDGVRIGYFDEEIMVLSDAGPVFVNDITEESFIF